MNTSDKCPRCEARKIKSWNELTDDEREVVKRLSDSRDWSPEERRRHRWCTRCWFESTENSRIA